MMLRTILLGIICCHVFILGLAAGQANAFELTSFKPFTWRGKALTNFSTVDYYTVGEKPTFLMSDLTFAPDDPQHSTSPYAFFGAYLEWNGNKYPVVSGGLHFKVKIAEVVVIDRKFTQKITSNPNPTCPDLYLPTAMYWPAASLFGNNNLAPVLAKTGYREWLEGQADLTYTMNGVVKAVQIPFTVKMQYYKYYFRMNYGLNSDGKHDSYDGHYFGSIYKPYRVGVAPFTKLDENGRTCQYMINKVDLLNFADVAGKVEQVFVDNYHDCESGRTYSIVTQHGTDYAGTQGLGSESGYIIARTFENHRFGSTTENIMREADVNYAVLFGAGSGNRNVDDIKTTTTRKMKELLVSTLGFWPDNVYVLLNGGPATGGLINEFPATKTVLAQTLAKIRAKSKDAEDSCFLFFGNAHGAPDLMGAWEAPYVSSTDFANLVTGSNEMPATREMYFFSQCYAQSMVKKLPQTTGKFFAWSSNTVEETITTGVDDWKIALLQALKNERATYKIGYSAWQNDSFSPYPTWGPTKLWKGATEHSFTFTYANGDSYQGYVYTRPVEHPGYAGSNFEIFTGKMLTSTTTPPAPPAGKDTLYEAGKDPYITAIGKYSIRSSIYRSDNPGTGYLHPDYGTVKITSEYHDAESNEEYVPLHMGLVTGVSFLRSEKDYIIKEGVSKYFFGNGCYEADVGDKYLFRYYYTNGDYYQGYVYRAPSAAGYYHGQKIIKKNELGLDGYYQILSASWTGETAKYGQVFIDYYKDGESGKGFIPLKKGTAVGMAYLGSESDYIVKDGVAAYTFGRGYYEADVGDKYFFRYYYSNGDYYQGYVYRAPSAAGYYHGQKIIKKNELGLNGYYQILTASWTGETAKYGQVFIDYYKDGESGKGFIPLKKGTAVGTASLGSESDYIVKNGVAAYTFGRGYYEADVGDKYAFRYTYGNGDYYDGFVYRAPGEVYYPGYTLSKLNETGKTGAYTISAMWYTGETAKYGQVFVTTYTDGDRTTAKPFTPLKSTSPLGSANLGSEAGYIISATLAKHYFGKGYDEADE